MLDFIRRSVAAKVSLIISLMVILTSLVVGSLFYISGNNILKNREVDEIKHNSRHLRHEILSFYERLVRTISQIPEIDFTLDPVRSENVLQHFLAFKENVIGISIKTRTGAPLIRLGNTKVEFQQGIKYEKLLSEGKSLFISQLLYLEISKNDKPDYEPVFLVKAENKHGYSFITISAKELFKSIEEKNDTHLTAIVYDPHGRIIYHPNPQKRYASAKTIKYTLNDEFQSNELTRFTNDNKDLFYSIELKYRGKDTLLYAEKLFYQDKYIAGLVLGLSKQEINTFRPALNLSNFVIAISFLLGFSYLGWLFTKYLLSNLNEITEQAQKYTQGEQDINIEVKSNDEIGILALTFQGMIRQVNERTRVLRKSERRIREARDQAEQALSSKSHLLEDLRKQKSEIERVSKDKDDLLAIVSHDLKNPLAVVETSMDIILEEEKGKLSSMAADLIRRSKSSARIALNLITDLLDLSRLEGGIRLDFERFNVDEMIESVVDSFFLKSKEKNIKILIHKENDYDLIADYGRVIQILSNIIGNSLKFTPKEGKIDITIKEYQTDLSYEGTNKGLEIIISDNGPGIPTDKLESIFDKFSQARKKDREIGTGLGLTICKNICELHNGDIYASSEPGKGATFTIRLPRLVYREDLKAPTLDQELTVLIVNDDEGFRKNARNVLTRDNYQVIEAKNGEEMLQCLEGNDVDLIVLDDEMPVKSGLEALEELLEKNGDRIPVIFLTDKINENINPKVKTTIVDMLTTEVEGVELAARVSSVLKPDSVSSYDKRLDPSKKTILIVDDEEGIRTLLYENFIFLGYNCLFAKNGVEAIFLIQKYNMDLVISDIRMSEVDGLTLTKVLKKEYPELPVILMSANIDNLSRNLTEKLGITKLYPKPFDIDKLNDFVQETIGGAFLKEEREVMKKKKSSIKIMPPAPQKNDDDKNSSIEQTGEKRRVLLVDDSEDMQTLFKVLLRKEALDLEIVSNGKEAVELFEKEKFDTVFMDMNMPVMGGKEAVERMRAFEKDGDRIMTHIVLLTADQYENDSDIKNIGFSSYIQKPLSREKILKEINHAFDS
ncbi:unnamed protein product [Chrysoparadoxa australica]